MTSAVLATTLLAALPCVSTSPKQNTEWVKQCVATYPEVKYLADREVRKTEEGTASQKDPYSVQLFGQKYVEFDRTIMTLHCLKLLVSGTEEAYQEFTQAQPEQDKLSRESFQRLHAQVQELLNAGIPISAIEASLVLGDIGKSEIARETFKNAGARNLPDHDDFHVEVMQILQTRPALSLTFSSLDKPMQDLLVESAHLAHFGHITHLEGGPSMFSYLETMIETISPQALDFALLVQTCDVAGALGHVNHDSSLVYTEKTHRAMQAMQEACRVLKDPLKTKIDAYNHYLTTRATWLSLDPTNRLDRALTRMGAMLRLFTKEEGLALKEAMGSLDPVIQKQISEQFDIQTGEEFGRTPTYMPAVLVNLANNHGLTKAVQIGLPFLAKVLAKQKELLSQEKAHPAIPLNFNKVAGVAKTNPDALTENGFTIDKEGNVEILPNTQMNDPTKKV